MSIRVTRLIGSKIIQPNPRSMEGVALVEFAMLLGILLPIALGMTMLAKLSDAELSVQQASRYSAWEATVYSRQALASDQSAQVESRFFEHSSAALQTTPANSSTNSSADTTNTQGSHHWWGSQATSTGLRDLASVARHESQTPTAQYTFDTGKAEAGLATGVTVAIAGAPFSIFPGNSWDLTTDGLLRSDVSLPLQGRGFLQTMGGSCGGSSHSESNNSESNDSESNGDGNATESSAPCLTSSGVILADGWGASSDQQSIERVRSLVPSSAGDILGSGVSFLLGSFLFPELDSLDDAFGHVDMQALPRYAQPGQ